MGEHRTLTDKFRSQLAEADVTLTPKQEDQLLSYYELLVEGNKRMNLTAVTEYEEALEKHFLDSLYPVKLFPEELKRELAAGASIIDVGTGAGLPGIPLAILFSESRVTLMDSLGKRVNFLGEVISALGLSRAEAVHSRAEDLGRDPAYRDSFALAVSRAVASLSPLSEYCLPFVKKGGYFLPYKGKKVEEELEDGKRAIQKLGGELLETQSYLLPGTDYERVLPIIRKKSATPARYPRKAGTPSKEPL